MMLSVIVPTYNYGDYIEECINSITNRLPEQCEVIAVDDGSTDDTRDKLQSLSANCDKLRVLHREHGGPSHARNEGIPAAKGIFVTFVDCDDVMHDSFFEKAFPLLKKDIDYYIFSMEHHLKNGETAYWTVEDHFYPDVSSFADDYIRQRKLLIYSTCNKLYKRQLIIDHNIRYDESCTFGEDRLFNYDYLKVCQTVMTSSIVKHIYLQRNLTSLSTCYVPRFFERSIELHNAKAACFLSLSKGTTEKERAAFVAYDLSREVENTINRFPYRPEEKEENLPSVNRLVFHGPWDEDAAVDILLVLGSENCGYKIEKALEIGRKNSGVRYIVSGGKPHISGEAAEAEFMFDYLVKSGVDSADITVEDQALCTVDNLAYSLPIIEELQKEYAKPLRIGIVTGGFHIPRTMRIAESIEAYRRFSLHYFPAYGSHTKPDNWFTNPVGRKVILAELKKNMLTMGHEDELPD